MSMLSTSKVHSMRSSIPCRLLVSCVNLQSYHGWKCRLSVWTEQPQALKAETSALAALKRAKEANDMQCQAQRDACFPSLILFIYSSFIFWRFGRFPDLNQKRQGKLSHSLPQAAAHLLLAGLAAGTHSAIEANSARTEGVQDSSTKGALART